MASNEEYAKIVRVSTNPNVNRGFQAKITLPSSRTLSNSSDYINIYCGIGSWECGLSTADRSDFLVQGGWRWFANTPDGVVVPTNASGYFKNGDTVTLLLAIDNTGKVVFRVNGVDKYISTKKFSEYAYNDRISPSRLSIASSQYCNKPLPSNLPAWKVFHDQFAISEMKYKNNSDNWVAVTSDSMVAQEHWPTPNSNYTFPDPLDYNAVNISQIANSRMYVALKNFKNS